MIYENGARYIKMDLHSHTLADTHFKAEFDNNEEGRKEFAKAYVTALKNQEISIVAITNHNLFDAKEYWIINKQAKEENILVLPGVEIPLSDGKRGIHTLFIFPPELAEKKPNTSYTYIEHFIAQMFPGERFEKKNEPKTSRKDIKEAVNILEQDLGYEYLTFFAHVCNDRGCFKELGWNQLAQIFFEDTYIKKNIHGFQGINESTKEAFEEKVKENSNKLNKRAEELTPAYIEASDPKELSQVGSKYSYIKLGEMTFDALKFAIAQPTLRVVNPKDLPSFEFPQIKNIKVTTEKGFKDLDLDFNSELNTLIGIRGSGKSSIVELIRYLFDIEPLEDEEYKEELLASHLGSGGKAELTFFYQGDNYTIRRVLNESPKIYKNDEYVEKIRPRDILPINYYGQKDLQKKVQKPGLRRQIVDDYIHEKLRKNNRDIEKIKEDINMKLNNIDKLRNHLDKKEELEREKIKTDQQIEKFKELKVDEQLKLEADFKKDEMLLKEMENYLERENNLFQEFKEELTNSLATLRFSSESNKELFYKLEKLFEEHRAFWEKTIKDIEKNYENTIREFTGLKEDFEKRWEEVSEQVAEIKRKIDIKEVSIDDYSKLIQNKEFYKTALRELENYQKQLTSLKDELDEKYAQLQELWHNEYRLRVDVASKINETQSLINIEIIYKGDKEEFEKHLLNIFQGSRINKDKIKELADRFSDGIELIKAIKNGKREAFNNFTENEFQKLKEFSLDNEKALTLYRVQDLPVIYYNGIPLDKLSLGHRASALLMMILKLDKSPLIIDQPEDDLDNQMVYYGLVKELLNLKGERQLIFATHNSNTPVLGDAEQVIVCRYKDDKIKAFTGSIDVQNIQKSIVDIMEGGKEAFDKRREIYTQWM